MIVKTNLPIVFQADHDTTNGRLWVFQSKNFWPDFRCIGQWDKHKKVFIPLDELEYTGRELQELSHFISKWADTGYSK